MLNINMQPSLQLKCKTIFVNATKANVVNMYQIHVHQNEKSVRYLDLGSQFDPKQLLLFS